MNEHTEYEPEGIHYQYAHGSSFFVDKRVMTPDRKGTPDVWIDGAGAVVNADTDSGPNSIGWIVMWVGEPPGEWHPSLTAVEGGEGDG